MYCGSEENGQTNNNDYLELSDKPHFLWLTPQINDDESFTDEYIINTHAYDGRGVSSYHKNPSNKKDKIYHKDPDGAQNTEEIWKFEKQCDENVYDACFTWMINAINAQTPGYYMQAKGTGDNLFLTKFDEKTHVIEEFLWTIDFH